MAPSRSVELVGRVLGDRYRLTRPVGTGASAHVYAADDTVLRRRVAVKVLHPGLAGDEAFTRRFRAEAQAAAALRHPHILQVYDWGEDAGTPYLVMALLEGGSLRAMVERGQLLTPSQAARVGADVARALDHAHRHGVVHRDIKPANLIFDDEGRATVADFGLARALAAAAWTEPIGGILGTARYASPEQVRNEPVDGRADVYALALVLVEAVTGTVPFASDDPVGTVMARLERPIQPGATLGPLADVVAAAGTVGRDARLDAAGMAVALEAAALRLPAAGPLPLVGLLQGAGLEPDDAPTEVPGVRPAPFDIEAVDRLPAAGRGTGQPTAPALAPVLAPTVLRPSGRHPAADPPTVAAVVPPPAATTPPAPPAPAEPIEARPARRRRRRWPWVAAVAALLAAGGGGGAGYLATRPAATRLVPALTHVDQARATALLAPLHLGLAVVSRTYDASVPAGDVISQQPVGGRVREGSTVDVTLSLGPQPIPVPALAGRTQADATTVLTTLGLRVGARSQAYSLTVPQGTVISSAPAAGTLLPGQAVALVVSAGKPFVTVPALTSTFAAAQAALSALGLPSSETDVYSDTVPRGQVISSTPGATSSVRVGTAVAVEVSKGPHLVVVPPVQGLSVTVAAEDLAGAGLVVAGVTGNPTATVTATSPAVSTVVHWQSQVTLITG